MEKLLVGKYSEKFRFVLISSFVLCLIFILLDCSALVNNKTSFTFMFYNFPNVVFTQKPESLSGGLATNISGSSNSLKECGAFSCQKLGNFSGNKVPKSVLEGEEKPVFEDYAERNRAGHVGPFSVSRDYIEPITKQPEIIGERVKEKGILVNNDKRNMTEQVTSSFIGKEVIENVTKQSDIPQAIPTSEVRDDPCAGRYIYAYDLPSRFNEELLKDCHSLMKWVDMCPYMSNMGLGLKVGDKSRLVLIGNGWYKTNQFALEVIFHNRMKQYKCLTKNSSLASAIYVPYYPGLDIGKYLWDFNTSVRDASPRELVKWVYQRPEWKRMWGRDHFLVGGRIAWDFRRLTDNDSDWGTNLMFLPEARNMSLLVIESGIYDNDFPIPYPTYFHPSKDNQVIQWQRRMRRKKRPYLFSFVGAPRPGSKDSIRDEIINQCQSSYSCNFLGCYNGDNKCDDPINVMKVFQSSVFCLQPPGDSPTRRSTFDSILAGCIPVFFHPGSAYYQYLWHLPEDGTKYSVYIPLDKVKKNQVIIHETLLQVPKREILAMREEVIKLIPRITYANPRSKLKTIEDAFDVAVEGILDRVEKIRREIKGGLT